jgi:hypothetical protein
MLKHFNTLPFLFKKPFKFITRYGGKLLLLLTFSGCIFLFSGGFDWFNGVMFGCTSYAQYRNTMLAPMFGGFLMTGAFGLVYAYKHRDSKSCLVGFGIMLLCYAAIEWLYGFL